MKRENYLSWDSYFMSIAIISAMRSKDAKTQSGACIADINKKIVGVGYNGLPIGLNDDNPRFWEDKNDEDVINSKHSYLIHAEANAIYNKNLADINGATLYVTLYPCPNCAKAIVQNGIKRVVYIDEKKHHSKNNEVTKIIFENSGVSLEKFSDLGVDDSYFINELRKLN